MMNEINTEEIIDIVTKIVTEALQGKGLTAADESQLQGRKKILQIGNRDLPQNYQKDAVIFSTEDYQKRRDIRFYDEVAVTRMSLMQLVDMASGRNTDPDCCAVVYALLEGIPVLIPESVLPHKRFQGKGSVEFYRYYEECADRLRRYGVKFTDDDFSISANYTARIFCNRIPGGISENLPLRPLGSDLSYRSCLKKSTVSVITESEAKELVKTASGGKIEFPEGAILTPSAKDIFHSCGILTEEPKDKDNLY